MTKLDDFEVVDLKLEHMREYYGDIGSAATVRGFAGLLDGRVVAVGGAAYTAGRVVVFAGLNPEIRGHKTAIHRRAVEFMNDLKSRHRRIITYCDETEPTAPKWLSRLGFRPTELGHWAWQTSV